MKPLRFPSQAAFGALSIALMLCTSYVQAAEPACHNLTPSTKTSDYPGESNMILSNNLARPTGKAENAVGQLLYITGRVTDDKCTPISGAQVDIWQTNPYGQYRWATQTELLNPMPTFAGNGRTTTDNMGRYTFVTLFPGTYGKNAPHIHMRVTYNNFIPLETTLYFKEDRRNEQDPKLQVFSESKRNLLFGDISLRDAQNPSDGANVNFDITLKGEQMYRSY